MITPPVILPPHSERGAALITVMLVFALASVMAMSLLSHQVLAIQRTASLAASAQSLQYALAGEELMRQLLAEKTRAANLADAAAMDWRPLADGVPVPEGRLSLQVEDAQARFNLHTLTTGGDVTTTRFLRLAALSSVPDETAAAIARRFSHRTASDDPFPTEDVSMLRLVPGFTDADMAGLSPNVTWLPDYQSLLNVNDASATVLKAYIPDDSTYEKLLAARTKSGFITLAQLQTLGMNTRGMSTLSHYYVLIAEAELGGRHFRLKSLIDRTSNARTAFAFKTVRRDWNPEE